MKVTLTQLAAMPDDAFEVLIAAMLEAKGFHNVLRVGGTNDEGFDLRAEWLETLPTDHARLTTWAVQCKRYSGSISPGEVNTILNSVLEPPTDVFPRRPDYFLLAATSRLTVQARSKFLRANDDLIRYGCHFLLWECDYVLKELNADEQLVARFFESHVALTLAHPDDVTRLQVVCDELADEVVLTFICEPRGAAGSQLQRTHVTIHEFRGLVDACKQIALGQPYWNEGIDQRLRVVADGLSALIPPTIRDRLSAGDGYLRLTSNVHVLPFELASDDTFGFLGSRYQIGRIHFTDLAATAPREWQATEVLLVAPDSGSAAPWLPNAEAEIRLLAASFEAMGPTVLMRGDATYSAFAQALAAGAPNIIHFAGHGVTQENDELGLLLSDGAVEPASRLLAELRRQSVVILSACSTGTALNSLSRVVVETSASLLVGFIGPVTDRAALVIARVLYGELLAGSTIGEAMRTARETQRRELPDDQSWASLVLFGDPLFRIHEAG